MQIKFGNKIRLLRKSRNISQEVLAQYLGVSFQAVSKWENDTAMPDISLLPVIASFFGVSIDELLDYNRFEIEKKVEDICRESWLCRATEPEKAEKILREGLKQFPGNEIILNNLLYTMEACDRSEEIITICKALIESTQDDCIKYDAIRILAETYSQTGQTALVLPTLEQIPEIYFTKLEQMALLLNGEESLNAARRQMHLSLDQTVDMLILMRDRLREKEMTEDACKCETLAKEVIEVFRRNEGESFETNPRYRSCRDALTKLS